MLLRSGHVTGANQADTMVECGDLLNQDYFIRQCISNSISYLTSVSSFNMIETLHFLLTFSLPI